MASSRTPTLADPKPSRLRIAGTLYRGNEGMWSWVLHRISGIGIYFFLLVHVLDTSLIRVSPEAYNLVIATYKNPIMGLGEVALVGAVVFHAMNGLRIIAVDAFPVATRIQRVLFWVVIGLVIVLMAGFTPTHLANVFGEH